MAQDDFKTFKLEATVEQVRYWVPQIADVARVSESHGPDFWKIVIEPYMPNACAVEMTVRDDEQFDAVLGGETYPTRALASHGLARVFVLSEHAPAMLVPIATRVRDAQLSGRARYQAHAKIGL